MMILNDRIVVTGLGVVSPLGIGIDNFHQSLAAGRSGITTLSFPWKTNYQTNRAGLVQDFNFTEFIDVCDLEPPGRTSQLALVAGKMALSDAGLATNGRDVQVGVVVGTAMAEGLERERTWESYHSGNDENGRHFPPLYPGHNVNDALAAAFNLQGPSHLVSTTCAAGNHATAWAVDLLQMGLADAMLAVGADTIGYVDLLGFSRLLLKSPDCCRPFDLNRKGMILSEGAGALLLEPLTLARRRDATILAEVAGCGLSCDAAGPFASKIKDIESLEIAARKALAEAKCAPEDIDFVSAHGSGTRLNDRKETYFLKKILGQHAYQTPVNSIKSMLGHAQGAAASFEAIASVLSFQHNVLYPTINYQTPDPDCDLDYVPNEARACRVNTIMSNAFGVGGNNAIVIFKRWQGA